MFFEINKIKTVDCSKVVSNTFGTILHDIARFHEQDKCRVGKECRQKTLYNEFAGDNWDETDFKIYLGKMLEW